MRFHLFCATPPALKITSPFGPKLGRLANTGTKKDGEVPVPEVPVPNRTGEVAAAQHQSLELPIPAKKSLKMMLAKNKYIGRVCGFWGRVVRSLLVQSHCRLGKIVSAMGQSAERIAILAKLQAACLPEVIDSQNPHRTCGGGLQR